MHRDHRELAGSGRAALAPDGGGRAVRVLAYLRHDMFVYTFAQLAAVEALSWLVQRRTLLFRDRRQLAEFTLSSVGVALCLWTPLLVQSGVSRPLHDLLLDLGDLMAARVLPIPWLFTWRWSVPLNMGLPALLAQTLPLLLLVSALGLGGAVYATYCAVREAALRPDQASRLVVSLALAVTVLVHSLGRSDVVHVAYGIPLILCAGLSVFGRAGAELLAFVSILPFFIEGTHFVSGDELARLLKADDSLFSSVNRQKVASFIGAETKPGEPIFVGCSSHSRLIANSIDVYYLAHRPGSTRYMQFDPGLVTTVRAQREMIADLERTKPRLLLRFPDCLWDEPNESMIEGSQLLDEYLSANYAPAETVADAAIWRRKGN